MVRVARLKRLIREGALSVGPDGLTPGETLTAVSKQVHDLAEEQHLCFLDILMPQLSAEGIHFVRPEEMNGEQERFLDEFFDRASISLPGESLSLFRPGWIASGVTIGNKVGLPANHRCFASAAYRSLDCPYPGSGHTAVHSAARPGGSACVHAAGRRFAPSPAAALPRL